MKYTFSDKLFGWPFHLIIIGWLSGMFFSSLIPSDSYLLVSITLSIIFGTVFSIAIFFRRKNTNLKLSQAFILIPIFYISIYCTVTFAVPLLLKSIFSTPETLVIKVLNKSHNPKTSCHKIDIGTKLKAFPTRALCLNSRLWQEIVIDRNIQVTGIKSPFGLYIDHFQIFGTDKALQPTPKSGAAQL